MATITALWFHILSVDDNNVELFRHLFTPGGVVEEVDCSSNNIIAVDIMTDVPVSRILSITFDTGGPGQGAVMFNSQFISSPISNSIHMGTDIRQYDIAPDGSTPPLFLTVTIQAAVGQPSIGAMSGSVALMPTACHFPPPNESAAYSCVDGVCVPDPNGPFGSLQACIDSPCGGPPPPESGDILMIGVSKPVLTTETTLEVVGGKPRINVAHFG